MSKPTQAFQARLQTAYPKGSVLSFEDRAGHLTFTLVDASFEGLKPIERHKAVYKIFNHELQSGEIHALSMSLKAPSELNEG